MAIEIPRSGSSSAPRGRQKIVGLTSTQERSLKKRLRKKTCSEPWVEAQIKQSNDVDEQGEPITYRYHDRHVYPPGGDQTAMVRCPRCGVFNPPNAMENDCCLDHAGHAGWGPSPSALAFEMLQRRNLRVIDNLQLKSEEVDDLKSEIFNFHRFRPKKKSFFRQKRLS